MKFIICESYEELSDLGAKIIAEQLQKKPDSVLGLATGSSPVGMYQQLIKMYQEGKIDFSKACSFNLDEYYPIANEDPNSYNYFMNDNLFNHVNFTEGSTRVPNGSVADPDLECKSYEQAVLDKGGIDLQVLGIGPNGHIGFNEPDDQLFVHTHVTGLEPATIEANARFFESAESVPTKAITMGMGLIMQAKKILLLISGKSKKDVFEQLKNGMVTPQNPASFLLLHPDVTTIVCL